MIKGNPIKIKGAITFLVNPGDTTIRIEDKNSGLLIMEISLTDDQLVKALSRLANTPCAIELHGGMDKWGKKLRVSTYEFKISDRTIYESREKLARDTLELLKKKDPIFNEWEPDGYFSSQNSFFSKDGGEWARVTIRKWE